MDYTPEIIGNRSLYSYLQNLLKSGRVQQANIIAGPQHVGKATLVSNLIIENVVPAMADPAFRAKNGAVSAKLQHKDPVVYNQAKLLQHDSHPNVYWVQPEKTTISIDAVRQVLNQLYKSATLPGTRHVVIDTVERLSLSAANALLKQLEEPNEGIIFWLLSHKREEVPATILSRCVTWYMHSVDEAELREGLPNSSLPAIRLAQGLPGQAVTWQNHNTLAKYELEVKDWLRVLLASDFNERLQLAKGQLLAKKGSQQIQTLDVLEAILRDILLLDLGSDQPITHTEQQQHIQALTKAFSTKQITDALQLVDEAKRGVQKQAQSHITLHSILMQLPTKA